MMSKILKAAGVDSATGISGAPTPARQDPVPPAAANAYGRRSALAAEAAARWEALERESEELRQALNTAEASLAVLTQTSDALTREIASLRFENERLVRENTAIQERINIAAETLLALRTLQHRPEPVQRAAERAIEEALYDNRVELIQEEMELVPAGVAPVAAPKGEWK